MTPTKPPAVRVEDVADLIRERVYIDTEQHIEGAHVGGILDAAKAVLSALAPPADYHLHCLNGCENACGELVDGKMICATCKAPFLECTVEICGGHNAAAEVEPLAGGEGVIPPPRLIECVSYESGFKEPADPVWYLEVGEYAAEFPTEAAANNFRSAILAALRPTPGIDREAVARIIDPSSFDNEGDPLGDLADFEAECRLDALAKADKIIAALHTPVKSHGE